MKRNPVSRGPAARAARRPKSSREWSPLESLESRRLLALITWDGGGDGTTLTQAANWTGDVTPGPADDAVVDIASAPTLAHGTGTFSVLSLTLAENLNLTGGTLTVAQASSSSATLTQSGSSVLTGAGNFTFSGTLAWNGGTMSGTGKTIITSSATLTLGGSAMRLFRAIENSGAASMLTGTLGGSAGPAYTFTNKAGATFTMTAGNLASNSGTIGLFINEGTLTVTTAGTAQFSGALLNNTGTVAVTSGTFTLNAGGTNTSLITADAPGTVQFNGTWTHTAASSVGGAGAVKVIGGTCSFQGTFNPTGAVTFSGGTVNVPGAFDPAALTVSGATATLDGPVSTPTLTVSGGTLGGAGLVTVGTAASWTGGFLAGTGKIVIPAAVTMTIAGGSPRLMRTIDNSGTINWTSGSIGASTSTSGTFNNLPGGVFNLTASATYDGSTPSAFNNSAGAVLNVAPTGTATFDTVVVANAGTINVTTGTFVLNGGGNNTGTITVNAPAALDIGGTWSHTASATLAGDGAVTFDGSSTFAGTYAATGAVTFKSGTTTIGNTFAPASVTINGGAAVLNADIAVGALTLSSGTLSGSGEFAVTATLTWSGGSMTGSGKTVLEASAAGTLNNTTHTLQRAFDNEGTIDWTAGSIAGSGGAASVFTNFAGAAFNASAAATWSGSATPGAFINHGTFTRTGAGTTTFSQTTFTNDGALGVAAGVLGLAGGGTFGGSAAVAGSATLELSGNAAHDLAAGYAGDGTVRFKTGTHTFAAATTFAPAVVIDTAVLDGAVALTFAGGLTWNSGRIATDSAAVPAGETLALETTSTKTLDGILNLAGTAAWNAGSINFNDARINSLAGAVFNAASTGSMNASTGVNLFSNAGTFNKITSATTTMGIRFNNSGALAVQAGLLVLGDIGTNTGTRSVASGATLRFSKGYTHNAASSITGAGTVEFTAGTHTFAATTSFGPHVVIGGSGTVLNGPGTLTFTRTLRWSSGTIAGAGQLLISPTCLATLDGTTHNLQRAMVNNGTVNWVDGAIVLTAATITNSVGRPFNASAPHTISAASGTTGLINKGTFNKSTASLQTIAVPFTQQGVLNVAAGTLSLNGGGSATAVRNIANGAVLHFGGAYTHGAGANLNGSGFVDFAAGAQNIPAALAIAAQLRFTGGSIVGAGALTLNAAATWTAGTVSGTGAIIIGPAGKLTLSSTATKFLGKNLTNNGAFIWTAGNIQMTGSTLTNAAGKTFTASASAQVLVGGGTNTFRNLGVFAKTGTTTTTFAAFNGGPGVLFNNTGTVNTSGGTLVLAGGVAQVSGFTLTAGKWNVGANTTLNIVGATIRLIEGAASVSLAGLNSTFAALNTLNVNQGILTVFGGRTLAITPNGGTFANFGVLVVRKGSALAVTGKFVQVNLPAASLRIEIAGTTIGTMGRVTATGDALLAGNLTITYLGFTPTAGQLFTFLTAGTRTNTFATTTLPPLAGLTSSIQYLANGARLRVV